MTAEADGAKKHLLVHPSCVWKKSDPRHCGAGQIPHLVERHAIGQLQVVALQMALHLGNVLSIYFFLE